MRAVLRGIRRMHGTATRQVKALRVEDLLVRTCATSQRVRPGARSSDALLETGRFERLGNGWKMVIADRR